MALDHRLTVRELVKFVGFVAFLGALLFGVEALLLGPFATPERIAEYHFGSEAMVGHGGEAYRSRTHYVALTGIPALLFLACVGSSWAFARTGRKLYSAVAVVLFASAAIILFAV